MSTDGGEAASRRAVVLDYMPRGRPDDDRPQYEKSPIAYVLETDKFGLYEVTLSDDAKVNIGDRVEIDPPEDAVVASREIDFQTLSSTARSELEHAINDVIDENESRFVDFYNEAQPITTRLHVLNLLPGIGEKLRNNILDERKRGPFEEFDDVENRVDGLHRPREVLVERIIEEIREEDLKYRIFARSKE